ncbi:MAG: CBS domain-containing protein [Candidatus Thermoplasmatota archaeon]
MSIESLVDRDYLYLGSNESISKALPKFESTDTLIIKDGNKYQGVLLEKDIARTKISLNTKVKTFMTHAPTLKINQPVEETARLMLENRMYQLPVLENKKIKGVVTANQILTRIVKQEIGNKKAEEYMTSKLTTIKPGDPLSKAIKLFRGKDINIIPAVEDNRVIGILDMHSVLKRTVHPENRPEGFKEHGAYVDEKEGYIKTPVQNYMETPLKIFNPEDKINDIVDHMTKNNLHGVLIGNENKAEGILTKKDLLEPIAVYTKKEPIIVQFAGELDKLTGFNKEAAKKELFEDFRKYEDYLNVIQIFVHLKQHNETRRDLHLIHCRMRLSYPGGMFIATEEGWGYMHAIREAEAEVERQIKRKKEKERDKRR